MQDRLTMNSTSTGGSFRCDDSPSGGGVYGGVSMPSLCPLAADGGDAGDELLDGGHAGATSKRLAMTNSQNSARSDMVAWG